MLAVTSTLMAWLAAGRHTGMTTTSMQLEMMRATCESHQKGFEAQATRLQLEGAPLTVPVQTAADASYPIAVLVLAVIHIVMVCEAL